MSERVDREIAQLFEGENSGACVAAPSHRLLMALRRRMGDEGTIVSPMRGLYALAEEWERLNPSERSLSIMRGMRDAHPDWVFCGPSAALVMGADVSYAIQRPIHVTLPGGSCSARWGQVRFHVLSLAEDEHPVDCGGIMVTPLARTTLDSLRWLDFREGMVVADCAVRGPGGRRAALESYFRERACSCHGVERALVTLAHADGRAESGGESIARAVMIEQGFMPPELQVWVPDPLHFGRWFRVDFLWVRADGRVIVGECDGGKKIFDPQLTGGRSAHEALLDQRRREGLITAYDVSVVRFTFEEAAGVSELVRKLDLYGVPRLGSPLVPAGAMPAPDWNALLRR